MPRTPERVKRVLQKYTLRDLYIFGYSLGVEYFSTLPGGFPVDASVQCAVERLDAR